MKEIKKVTLIGLGAMGVYFAPRLLQTLGEGGFRIIADGARKARLATQGVTINGVNYRFPIVTPGEEGDPADLIIVAVKNTTLDEAIRDIKNQVGEHTIILPILNGVESEEKVAAAYGWEHVLYAFMRVSVVMQDGRANFDLEQGTVHFGERDNTVYSEKVLAVKALFDKCKIPYRINEDMIHGLWFKFMCNVGENMTCALLGVPFGAFRESEHANALRRAAMREVAAVANRMGIQIGEKEIEIQEGIVKKLPYENKPSTLQDLENKRKTEIDTFSGTVVRLGKKYGVPTPVNTFFDHAIRVLEEKNAGLIKNTKI